MCTLLFLYEFILDWEYLFCHHHPVPPPYKPKRAKGEAKLRVHKSGCARSEGYYKIEMKEKAQYLKSALRHVAIVKKRDDVDQQTASVQVRQFFTLYIF